MLRPFVRWYVGIILAVGFIYGYALWVTQHQPHP
jgi:nitrate/TMAO reductase-like tetraheme cytochrome c subunit